MSETIESGGGRAVSRKEFLGLAMLGAVGAARPRLTRAPMIAMMGGDGGAWRNPYVTDGLIAMWDGEWNAGGGVHDANATVWKDLSGNGNDLDVRQITGVTWTDTSIQNTSGQYQMAISDSPLPDTHQIEVVFSANVGAQASTILRPIVQSGNRDLCVIIKGDAGSYGILSTGNTGYSGWTGLKGGTQQEAADNWAMQGIVSISASDLPRFIAMDGLQLVPDVKTWESGSTSYVSIGGGSRTSQWGGFNGNVYTVRFYSRALTTSEIAANYAIDKARFGLT